MTRADIQRARTVVVCDILGEAMRSCVGWDATSVERRIKHATARMEGALASFDDAESPDAQELARMVEERCGGLSGPPASAPRGGSGGAA